jgi:hypothetical protein
MTAAPSIADAPEERGRSVETAVASRGPLERGYAKKPVIPAESPHAGCSRESAQSAFVEPDSSFLILRRPGERVSKDEGQGVSSM